LNKTIELLRKRDLTVFPCTEKKTPNFQGSWKSYNGPCDTPVFGIAIPSGIIVIDLDYYKGVTQGAVERALGTPLNWQDAELQKTRQGGAHYAFRAPDGLRQGSDLLGITGFDTRGGGRGYICSGEGYTSLSTGVMRLSLPDTLPELPPIAQERLLPASQQDTRPEKRILPQTLSIPIDEARSMLKCIDPECSRDIWMQVGLSLKSLLLPFELFNEWSSGAYHGRMPSNYDPLTIEYQYKTFKPEGKIGPATLRYYARKGGWKEDWSQVFASRDPEAMKRIAHDICGLGSEPGEIIKVINDIKTAELTALDRELILNALRVELRENGMWSKRLGHEINEALAAPSSKRKAQLSLVPNSETIVPNIAPEGQSRPHPIPETCTYAQIPERSIADASDNHGMNALNMLLSVFEMRLRKDDQNRLRWWNGSHWERVTERQLTRSVSVALMPGHARLSNVKGTVALIQTLAVPMQAAKPASIRCQNGVLDLTDYRASETQSATGIVTPKEREDSVDCRALALHPHERTNYNTTCLPVNYNPQAGCKIWLEFVDSLFGGLYDGEDRIKLLQEMMGVALCEENLNLQKALALTGQSRGGKGVIIKVLQTLLGQGNYGLAEFTTLHSGKTQTAFANNRIVFDAEAKSPERRYRSVAAGFFNKLVAGDRVAIPQLYQQDPLETDINCVFMMACNDLPNLGDASGATAKRVVSLEFDRSFYGREDRNLAKRLTRPEELEGILIWCLEGLVRFKQQGKFTLPESSRDNEKELLDAEQPLSGFVRTFVRFRQGGRVLTRDLYDAYKGWCLVENQFAMNITRFGRELKHILKAHGARYSATLRCGDQRGPGYIGCAMTTELTKNELFDPGEAFR
jgi:P4 family phage/plasmid primase-like protien